MQQLWNSIWSFPKKLKINLPYDIAIPFLAYIQRGVKQYTRDIYTSTLIATLFTVAKLWKQSQYPTNSQQIKKM
jgi:hypothetical protein